LVSCTSATPEMTVINGAADSLGGAERIKAANTLVLEGAGENGNLGQNLSPAAQLPIFKVTDFKLALDLTNSRYRLEQTRTPSFVSGNMAPVKQIQGLDGTVGYNIAPNGTVTRTNDAVVKDRRFELIRHPIAAVKAALAEGAQVTNARKVGSDDVVDVTTAQGDKFTLHVDSTTKQPSKMIAMTYNANLGDVALETTYADYANVDGLKLPERITIKTDKYETVNIRVSKHTINGDAGNLAAPAEAQSAAVPSPAAPTVTAEPISRGIWYLTGGSHHSILVEFADHLALIEAPQNEARTAAVLAKVKELKADKPLKYVINTHHHFDHSGGVRRAIAEGATLITHALNKSFYEEAAARKHTMTVDELAKSPKPPMIQAVAEKHVLKDATRSIELYPVVGSRHSESMLIVYFPSERLLVEADLYSPPAANAPANAPPAPQPFAANLLENVQNLKLSVDRIVPIHGRIVPFRELVTAARGSD